jgi:hypothetical protein
MRARRRLVVAVGSFALAVAGLTVGGAAPASAGVCAHAGVSSVSTGACVPVLNDWISPCVGASENGGGVPVSAEVCVPTPV